MMNIMWELLRFKNQNYTSPKKVVNNLKDKDALVDWKHVKELFYDFAEFPGH